MPTTEQLRGRLIDKLKELFQLDQPDLDFGFYRIMHAKAEQVSQFLDKDLLKIVEDAFGKIDDGQRVKLQAEYEKAIEQAKEFGVEHPEESLPVKKAKAALDTLKDSVSAEGEIYDHLYRFFERYYHEGDFISRRYYSRETSGKAAPFAVPYNGEEVKLHWANADQYYIKTAEYLNNFTADLRGAEELQAQEGGLLSTGEVKPLRLHFRIVEATEGEHSNVKETDKRFFIIHKEKPVEFNEAGELVINFEFRSDPEKGSKQEGTWRDHRNTEAVNVALKALDAINEAEAYKSALKTKAPTEKDSTRPLLGKYINQYTARNSYDYFIHKDLGGFLWRELDFYIKNEIMRLDDIENAELPAVESYFSRIKVLRCIAHKLIDFLTQLEEFQKKLWLKKKFVVETNYCITLDRVPVELYPEIAVNEAQHDEWVELFAINEIEPDTTGNPGYSKPLSAEFLKANNKLVLDTRFFDDDFKAMLITSIESFDEQCDGLLIHSENFQALNLLQKRFRREIKCSHIDPPYNTATSGFLYKNSYEHSSWLSMMNDRIALAVSLLTDQGDFICHIDENEYERLNVIFDNHSLNASGTIIWDKKNPMLGRKGIATQHEYIIWRSKHDRPVVGRSEAIVTIQEQARNFIDSSGGVNSKSRELFRNWLTEQDELSGGEKAYKYLDDNGDIYRLVAMGAPEKRTDPKFHIPLEHPISGKNCPVPPNGWSRTPETLSTLMREGLIVFGNDDTTQPQKKVYLRDDAQKQLTSVYSDGKSGKAYLDPMGLEFPYCHPVSMYEHLLSVASDPSTFIDFFAGSGTNGHAVLNLRRATKSKHRSILVEMGDHFDTVLKPRISKVVYSENWKDGKPYPLPQSSPSVGDGVFNGISHCYKYLRLESYEDTLNNLSFDNNPMRDRAVSGNPALREDFMLRYMLDVESRGSQSLLNIDAFANPTAYTLKVKKSASDEYTVCNVDLLETFNYLIGLRVIHISAPQSFVAKFNREKDPELPEDQNTRLVIDGRIKKDTNGPWWFRKVEGWVPANFDNPNNGQREKMLIVWRKLTGDLEKDNLMLDEYFKTIRINPQDFEFNTIYVNGSNNLPNLRLEGEDWKVRLIEEDFMRLMWDVENV